MSSADGEIVSLSLSYNNVASCEDSPCRKPKHAAAIDNEQTFWLQEDEWTEQEEKDAREMLEKNRECCLISEAHRRDDDAAGKNAKAWNQFYRQHQTNFFRDRHYLASAFPNELGQACKAISPCLVEIG